MHKIINFIIGILIIITLCIKFPMIWIYTKAIILLIIFMIFMIRLACYFIGEATCNHKQWLYEQERKGKVNTLKRLNKYYSLS